MREVQRDVGEERRIGVRFDKIDRRILIASSQCFQNFPIVIQPKVDGEGAIAIDRIESLGIAADQF